MFVVFQVGIGLDIRHNIQVHEAFKAQKLTARPWKDVLLGRTYSFMMITLHTQSTICQLEHWKVIEGEEQGPRSGNNCGTDWEIAWTCSFFGGIAWYYLLDKN